MGKAPASQFYWGDLKRDVEYHLMSFEARGIWIEMLTSMWDAKERGKVEGTIEQLSGLLGCPVDKLRNAIKEVSVTKTGDVTECNDLVTVINRRMFREERERKLTRCRVQKFRNAHNPESCNTNITPPSSSSSSSSKNKRLLSDEDFLKSLKEKFHWVNFDQEMTKIDAWFMVHTDRKKTRRFIVKWISKIEKPMEIKDGKGW